MRTVDDSREERSSVKRGACWVSARRRTARVGRRMPKKTEGIRRRQRWCERRRLRSREIGMARMISCISVRLAEGGGSKFLTVVVISMAV